VKRHIINLISSNLVLELDVADLRTIAVSNDEFVTLIDQLHELLASNNCITRSLLEGTLLTTLKKSIATKSNKKTLTLTSLKATGVEKEEHKSLAGVKTVLSLVENDGVRAIDNISSLLVATHCREAVHEDNIGLGVRKKLGGDLERHELLATHLSLILRDTVAHPTVSIDNIDTVDSLNSGLADKNLTTRGLAELFALFKNFRLDIKALTSGTSNTHLVTHDSGSTHEIISHIVVKITTVSHLEALKTFLTVLLDSHHISEHLKRMSEIIKSVDNRDGGVFSKLSNISPLVNTSHDDISHTAKNLTSITERFLDTKRRISNGVEDSMTTHLAHTSLKRHTSTKRRLLEKHQKSLPFKSMSILLGVGLKIMSLGENRLNLLLSEAGNLQNVTNHFQISLTSNRHTQKNLNYR